MPVGVLTRMMVVFGINTDDDTRIYDMRLAAKLG
jgi:hypothetical protein